MYTCFKFRFSTLKWKSAIIGRVNGTSGRVYNMQHTKYNASDGAKNELICRTVVCRVLREHLTSELLTGSMIGARKPWPYKQLPQQIIHKWRCSRTFMYTIYMLILIDIMPTLVYTIIVLEDRNTTGVENKVLENEKKCLIILLKCFKIVSVKGTW